MAFLKKLLSLLLLFAVGLACALVFWATRPVLQDGQLAVEFTVKTGSSARSAGQQIADAGAPLNTTLFALLSRVSGKSAKVKAGSYELMPGTTPYQLIGQLVQGAFAHESLSIIEGWTFKQMRDVVNQHPTLRHDTIHMTDGALLAQITTDYAHPEGLFSPDTYMFAAGTSDLQIYRQAHAVMMNRLSEAWAARDPAVPYKSPYEALIMASIVEKETGRASERSLVAGVFVNRLRLGMLLQTDPSVIYGMGANFKGNIRKRDLTTDTPYNTYRRAGLPPTPIALPGTAALTAALNPAVTDALFFVARRDGSSAFSSNLSDHNRAVNKYQR